MHNMFRCTKLYIIIRIRIYQTLRRVGFSVRARLWVFGRKENMQMGAIKIAFEVTCGRATSTSNVAFPYILVQMPKISISGNP